jgi:DNA-binding Lrp family transcriptional regulator
MREDILTLLESDSRLTAADMAVMLDLDEKAVADEIRRMKDDRVICGFNTLINWDKTDKEYVTALIEVKVIPQRDLGFDQIAGRIYRFNEVKAVYLMSGGFDLTVIVEAKTIRDVAFFVSDKLAALESVTSTATHFVLKKYKDHGVILEHNPRPDERMIVSP